MNAQLQITLPTPTVIIDFSAGQGPINGCFSCAHCGQYNILRTEIQQEKIEKVEQMDVQQPINIKQEEKSFNFVLDESDIDENSNYDPNMFSAISDSDSENTEDDEASVSNDQHDNSGICNKRFNDLDEIPRGKQQTPGLQDSTGLHGTPRDSKGLRYFLESRSPYYYKNLLLFAIGY